MSTLHFADGVNAADKGLQQAVWKGKCLEVSTALDNGSNPNSRGINGYPLLIVATYRGHLRVVHVLLDHGANPGASVVYPSALEAAIRSGHSRIAYILLKFGVMPTWRDANLAALCGRTRLLRTFLKSDLDVNRFEGVGRTASVTLIMSAAFAGETTTVQALAEKGADVNLSNENGWTALLSAASCGHTEMVRLLLSMKADANAADKGGDTPLKMAAQEDHMEIVVLLREAGATG